MSVPNEMPSTSDLRPLTGEVLELFKRRVCAQFETAKGIALGETFELMRRAFPRLGPQAQAVGQAARSLP